MSNLAVTSVASFTARSLHKHYTVLPATTLCLIDLISYLASYMGHFFLYVALLMSFVS